LIAVLDYGIGNLRSAEKALQRVGAEARLVTSAGDAAGAAGVVLPGVGAFGACMAALRSSGLDVAAVDAAASGRPFIGVCVGMQLLYDASDESPGVSGLGVLPGVVQRLPEGVKHPQMQWNRLSHDGHAMFTGLGDDPWVYFVHSYVAPADGSTVATCAYGGDVVAAVARDNVWATQFHPEKSGANGLQLLRNFVEACT
jgi:imidazole glycerol-phosphate synthase subunit HisH